MAVNVSRITNANVYVNGENLLGMCEEVTVPRPKAIMSDHKGLGMVGRGEFPSGLDKIEAKFKWASLYEAPERLLGTPFTVNLYQVRGHIETYGATGVVGVGAAVFLLSGPCKDMGELKFMRHDNVDVTTTVAIYQVEEYLNGRQIFKYNLLSNELIVNGIDVLAPFRANVGG
jgi:uncharacterized protein